MTTQINNNFKSKVFKAAHKIYNKRYKIKSTANWSKSLVKAWNWAKDKLIKLNFEGLLINIWTTPNNELRRWYMSDKSYVQFRQVSWGGSYGAHRACKGDYDTKITAVGVLANSILEAVKIDFAK